MRALLVALSCSLLLLGAPSAKAQSVPKPPPGYQTLVANVWIGKKLYLRTDLTFIGTIIDIAPRHRFPDGTTRPGVLVRFRDGSADWIPRQTLQRIYVTKAS